MLAFTLLLACSGEPSSTDTSDGRDTAPGGSDIDADGFSVDDGDCDDTDAAVNPGAAEVPYDGRDNDCDPATSDDDVDGDGFSVADDCDDADPSVFPGASEVANDGVDNDCDAATTDDDLDGDGLVTELDCDDTDAALGAPTPVDEVDATTCATYACVEVSGRLRIGYADADEMEAYACVFRVDGSLELTAIEAPDLGGLRALREVEGDVYLQDSPALTSLGGLERLHTVAGRLTLDTNAGLASLAGLEGLRSVGYGLEVVGNASLGTLAALSGLTTVQASPTGGDNAGVSLRDNPRLASLDGLQGLPRMYAFELSGSPLVDSLAALDGAAIQTLELRDAAVVDLDDLLGVSELRSVELVDLPALTSVAALPAVSTLTLTGAPLLASLEGVSGQTGLLTLTLGDLPVGGLDGVTVASGYAPRLEVYGLANVRTLDGLTVPSKLTVRLYDMEALEDVGALTPVGTLSGGYFADNPALRTLQGLSSVTSAGTLTVARNASLSTLEGLERLASAQSLEVSGNAALVSLDGLAALTTLSGDLTVEDNALLADISALHALDAVDDVTFRANPSLPTSAVEAFLAEVSAIGGTVTVE